MNAQNDKTRRTRIQAVLAALAGKPPPPATDAWRLYDASAATSPLHDVEAVDHFGPLWIVSATDGGGLAGWEVAVGRHGCRSVWGRLLEKSEKSAPRLLAGDSLEQVIVHEAGLGYEVRPAAGYNCGLFLDQRDNRRRVRARVAAGDRVLNLFAYTCSFSVAAAAAGATVTSVDLHRGYLDWGRRNFEINDLDPAAHYWTKGDSFDWLAAFAKKGRFFDGVILDPPTFSRGTTKKVFRVEQDYAELVSLAARVVAPGGWLLACANTRRQTTEAFAAMVDVGLRDAGVRFVSRAWPSMPPDFGRADYLKTLWLDART